ncbi:MAG TPA: PTS sugar transporter subunit IIA [Syntrophomonas sp.]|nr:PTS sugar transporter subunit IIA [Syntrophomonas sp.]
MHQAFSVDDLLKEELVMLNVKAENMEHLMAQMCNTAFKKGYVTDSYLEAVLEREKLYPTGLPTEIMKVALPHSTDRSHVQKPGIFIAQLAKPVAFKEMGEGERDVMAEMVFMLAVKGDLEQLTVLQNIVGMFTKPEALTALKHAKTSSDIINAVKTHLGI